MITNDFNYDNKSESPIGSITGDFTNVPDICVPITICAGYNDCNCITRKVNSVDEFRNLIFDAIITCEENRTKQLYKIIEENKLTENEESFIQTAKKTTKFHDINFPHYIREKFKKYGEAKKMIRYRPVFCLRIVHGKYKYYIRSPRYRFTGGWTGDFQNPSNIDFKTIYKCCLDTESHLIEIEKFIGMIKL